jgi:NAD(P)-dependent dehydrogenase (short-subunit alcohol dehydrogenase family)
VAVCTGATGGLGRFTLEALAAHHGKAGKGLRVYLVGRNPESANNEFAKLRKSCPDGDFRFVRVNDLALISDIDQACDEITRSETAAAASEGNAPRVDMLFMSQGTLDMKPWTGTKEGLEWHISLLYFSRMKTILNLMPLLLNAPVPAHVVSVFAAGAEGDTFDPDDLMVRKPGRFGVTSTRHHVVYMKTLSFEYLAQKYPGKIALVHVFPGLVLTDGLRFLPKWMQLTFYICYPLLKLTTTPGPEVGERILFLTSPVRFPAAGQEPAKQAGTKLEVAMGTDLKIGSGAYAVGITGMAADAEKMHKAYDKYDKDELRRKIVAYTLRAFEEIKAGRVFKD